MNVRGVQARAAMASASDERTDLGAQDSTDVPITRQRRSLKLQLRVGPKVAHVVIVALLTVIVMIPVTTRSIIVVMCILYIHIYFLHIHTYIHMCGYECAYSMGCTVVCKRVM